MLHQDELYVLSSTLLQTGLKGLSHSAAKERSLLWQIVSEPEEHPSAADACQRLRNEYVVRIDGTVRLRKDPNPRMPTGNLEVAVEAVTILNTVTRKLPFLPADDDATPGEETRLRHRVLDLRYIPQLVPYLTPILGYLAGFLFWVALLVVSTKLRRGHALSRVVLYEVTFRICLDGAYTFRRAGKSSPYRSQNDFPPAFQAANDDRKPPASAASDASDTAVLRFARLFGC